MTNADRLGDLVERLRAIDEELADLAIDSLREAVREGATKRPATERAFTRARTAVAKAASILESAGSDPSGDEQP